MTRNSLFTLLTTCTILAAPGLAIGQSAAGGAEPDPAAAAARAQESTPVTQTAKRTSPRAYLAQAKSWLDSVPEASLNHDAKKLVASLRQQFADLDSAYQAKAPAAQTATQGAIDGNVTGAVDWQARFSDVERRLTEILGAGSSFSPSAEPDNVLTAQVEAAAAAPAESGLPPSTRSSTSVTGNHTTTTVDQTNGVTSMKTTPSSPAPTESTAVVPSPAVPTTSPVAPPAAGTSAPMPAPIVSPRGQLVSPAATAAAAAPVTPTGAPAGNASAVTVTPLAGTGINPQTTATTTVTGAGSSTVVSGGSANNAFVASGSSAVAAAGVLAGKIGLKDLDPKVRGQLNQFRISVELFFDATTRLGGY